MISPPNTVKVSHRRWRKSKRFELPSAYRNRARNRRVEFVLQKEKTIEVVLDARHNDNQAAYRIAPDSERPVIISIKDETFKALNISGTGIAFRSEKFDVGSRCAAKIRLPSEGKVFPVVLEVVAKQKDLCRCCFRDIHEEAENLLHSYILELQKLKIRQNHGHG